MRQIRRIIFGILTLLCVSSISAQYEDFVQTLTTLGVDVQSIASRENLARYEVARLLNLVECVDCLHPSSELMEQYDRVFWGEFTQLPGKDFNDISYRGGIYQGESYYYCVAYAGDQGYMRGYPLQTSPICGGLFCGSRYTSNAEFIQVIINILGQYIYDEYNTNWQAIQRWMRNLNSDSYASRNLNASDRQVIENAADSCEASNCRLASPEQFSAYLKYCMFNLQACQMIAFGDIGQAYWPVAELNIIRQQGILDIPSNETYDIYDYVNGQTMLDVLYNLYGVIQCTYDNDYDCDEVLNADDNCANTYNPSQIDQDNDSIGDVCDDDIDGDGITNAPGVVDTYGRINVALLEQSEDNCLFLANNTQIDSNDDGLGDACSQTQDMLGLYLRTAAIRNAAPLTVSIEAIASQENVLINWDMGDGTIKQGQQIEHRYTKPGLYIVSARAQGARNEAIAKTTIIVGANPSQTYGLAIDTDQVVYNRLPGEFELSVRTQGIIDEIVWDMGDGTTLTRSPTQSVRKQYVSAGIYAISAVAKKDGETVAAARIRVGVGQLTQGVQVQSQGLSTRVDQTFTLNTRTAGIDDDDIAAIYRDMGDGNRVQTNEKNLSYSYINMGPRVIIQDILLNNGLQYSSMLTIHVDDPTLYTSHGSNLVPSQLRVLPGDEVNFQRSSIGDQLQNPIIGIQQYAPGRSQRRSIASSSPLQYRYTNPGTYYPQSVMYINQCQYLENQATIVVDQTDQCLAWYIDGENTRNICDMDQDGIPDSCDNDIDGDGIKNLIGLILPNNTNNCRLRPAIVNIDLLQEHVDGVCSLDNCPFVINDTQNDLNLNNIGDSCEQEISSLLNANRPELLTYSENDRDGDGIPDVTDLCPDIPESYNGITDGDGCPEIGSELACPNYARTSIPEQSSAACPVNTSLCADNTCNENCIDNGGNPVCNLDGVCNITEGCNCSDCLGVGTSCSNGLICLSDDSGVGRCLPDPSNQSDTIVDTIPIDPNCTDPTECFLIAPISIGECNQCPCQFADYANTLHTSDMIRVILRDRSLQYLYGVSPVKRLQDILIR